MENTFWTLVAIPIFVGIVVALISNFIIQPWAKKVEAASQVKSSASHPKKKTGKIISVLASITPRKVIFATMFFVFGVLFTIIIAIVTNTNLANVVIFDQGIKFSRMCGKDNTSIVGQVTSRYSNDTYSGYKITTSPPTSSVVTDNKGYFSICDLSVGTNGQEYTIYASKAVNSSYQHGSEVITVFPGKKTIVIITTGF